jgi:hypothetical protein
MDSKSNNQLQATRNSPQISELESKEVSRKTLSEVSIYSGGVLTDAGIAKNLKKLQAAFPKMLPVFFNLLSERLIANGFSDERLSDAVNSVIDNFSYKELNISDIIRFDKKIKLYTYQEVAQLVTEFKAAFADFDKKEIDGVMYWIPKNNKST